MAVLKGASSLHEGPLIKTANTRVCFLLSPDGSALYIHNSYNGAGKVTQGLDGPMIFSVLVGNY